MIKIYGTSHIAQESYKAVKEIIKDENPELIAIELDKTRLRNLSEDRKSGFMSLIPFLMNKLQERLGKQTGIMPGEEMLRAVEVSREEGIDLALIDQPIQKTLMDIQKIPLLEKAKLVMSLLAGFFLPYLGFGEKIDLRKVPEEEFIERAMKEFREVFPTLYHLLLEKRNIVMVDNLRALEHRYDKIVAFVGAGHKKGMESLLEE